MCINRENLGTRNFSGYFFVSGPASNKKGLGNVYTQEKHSTWLLPPNRTVQINIFLKNLWTSHIQEIKKYFFLNIHIRPRSIAAITLLFSYFKCIMRT